MLSETSSHGANPSTARELVGERPPTSVLACSSTVSFPASARAHSQTAYSGPEVVGSSSCYKDTLDHFWSYTRDTIFVPRHLDTSTKACYQNFGVNYFVQGVALFLITTIQPRTAKYSSAAQFARPSSAPTNPRSQPRWSLFTFPSSVFIPILSSALFLPHPSHLTSQGCPYFYLQQAGAFLLNIGQPHLSLRRLS